MRFSFYALFLSIAVVTARPVPDNNDAAMFLTGAGVGTAIGATGLYLATRGKSGASAAGEAGIASQAGKTHVDDALANGKTHGDNVTPTTSQSGSVHPDDLLQHGRVPTSAAPSLQNHIAFLENSKSGLQSHIQRLTADNAHERKVIAEAREHLRKEGTNSPEDIRLSNSITFGEERIKMRTIDVQNRQNTLKDIDANIKKYTAMQ